MVRPEGVVSQQGFKERLMVQMLLKDVCCWKPNSVFHIAHRKLTTSSLKTARPLQYSVGVCFKSLININWRGWLRRCSFSQNDERAKVYANYYSCSSYKVYNLLYGRS